MAKAGARDYRDLRRKGEPARSASSPEKKWWRLTGEACANSVRDVLENLEKAQSVRLRQQVVSARLYGNVTLFGRSGAAHARLLEQRAAAGDRVTYNAVQSVVDTLTAKVGEAKPRPYFLTSGGDYRQQRRAKNLNRFVEGVFYETKTYDIGLKAFRDGAIWGDGFVHVFGRNGKICHERVLGSELWVDEIEAQYGFPRSMHRVKLIDREQLVGLFPERGADILRATRASDARQNGAANDTLSDMIRVAESWHLGVENEDGECEGGKHIICLPDDGVVLTSKFDGKDAATKPTQEEEWPHNFFPFARFSWCERPLGYWSQGLAEQIQGDQIELNKELWVIQRSMHLAGSFKLLLKYGSKVVSESLNNEIGTVVNWAGDTPPQYIVPQPIHEVYFTNVERIIERIYRKAGASELAASAKKPQGLDSGRALREFQDIEADRHRTTQRQNDNLYLQIAALDVAIAREMAKHGRLEAVRVPGKQAFDLIDFKKDIGSLKDSEFVMQCFPVSRLPRDPAGRLQTIQEYIQAGFMSPRQGRRALDFPDLDSIESLASAQEDILMKTLDAMVDEGEYAPPEPTDDLQLGKELVLEYIQRYRQLDLEPERMDMLRAFNSQIDMLVEMAQPPAPMPMPGGAPQAAPEAPPTSDLVPNAPGMQAAA